MTGKRLASHEDDDIVRYPEESGSKESNDKDEFQAEVRDDLVPEFTRLAEKSIEYAGNVLGLAVPQRGEADVGINWLETH